MCGLCGRDHGGSGEAELVRYDFRRMGNKANSLISLGKSQVRARAFIVSACIISARRARWATEGTAVDAS